MNWLFRILLVMFPLVLSSQTPAPMVPITTASLLPSEKKVSFRIRWRQTQQVDSTMLYVYLSTSNTPVVARKAGYMQTTVGQTIETTDTVSFTIPDDTTTYRFQLMNLRRGLVSLPSNVNWRFEADRYYTLTRVHIRPREVSVDTGGKVQFCAFLEYNDGSIVIRDRDKDKPTCITEYSKFDSVLRKSVGARLRNANTVCLQWQATGGTIENEVCSNP